MDEEQEPPKKIALKVPSLFIKSAPASSQSDAKGTENGDKKKIARPMPASMKKKLEESKKNEESVQQSPLVGDISPSSSTTSNNNGENKPKRPMPASARRKVEESINSSSNGTGSKHEEVKRLNKPMPSSVKMKLLEGEQIEKCEETDSADTKELNEKSEQGIKAKPMPASARKRMEETINETESLGASAKSTEKSSISDSSEPKKIVKRPMPASARRKLLEGSNVTIAADVKEGEQDTSIKDDSDDMNDQTLLVQPEPDIDDNKNEQAEETADNMDESTKETKKINISLGGIKFPTFKKPMPASAKKKAEVKEQKTASEENESENAINISTSKVEEQNVADQSLLRSTRRGRSTNEFMELGEKFPCDVCGQEFYTLGSKKRHEQIHLPKSEDAVKKKSKKEYKNSDGYKKKKQSQSKYKGMKNCPLCNKGFSNWKKIANHVRACGAKHICTECDRKFRTPKELETHNMKAHNTKNLDVADVVPVPLSSLDLGDDSVPSPMSVDSKNSSKTSIVEKPKAMPKSVKAKLQKDDGKGSEKKASRTEAPKELSTGVQSFKRKIADVLSNLGSKSFTNPQSPGLNDRIEEESDDDGPPRKKIILSKKDECESIRGHPMPASVKKKLQERGSRDMDKSNTESTKKKSTPKIKKVDKDLDDLECQVCHKVFSGLYNRQKHEKNVHKIENPRGRAIKSTAAVSNSMISPPPSPKPEKIVAETEKIQEPREPKVDFSKISGGGVCPICSKYISARLKRHIRTVHKITETSSSNSTLVKQPVVVRPSAPKSYKIYKTATNKLKQKFSSSTSTKKPIVSLENVIPISKIAEDIKTEIKSENKVIGSTASSDLRCACCDKIFQVKCDFYEHMTMKHPKSKRLITCKLCDHKFSHEEDFFLHVQFKHPSLVDGMKEKNPKSSTKKSNIPTPAKEEPLKQRSSSRRTDKSKQHEERPATRNIAMSKLIAIKITSRDKQRADAALKKKKIASSRKSQVDISSSSTSTRTTRRSLARAQTPEPMEESFVDNEPDDHFDDSAMQVEEEESEIAITATFSQKPASPQKSSNATGSFELDPMHCSTCSEVFYSYEALRKHELYFHNVKTTKMCPICGVYPTRLSRHLLAHENKTVRCSCVPCNLSFPEFSQLLKHNLEKHPGVNGGALTASNKPREQIQTQTSKAQQNESLDAYRCLICDKEFPGSASARRHVRRVHSEQGDNAENFVEKVDSETKDKEVEEILQDTNKKLLDPNWDDDDDDVVEVPKKPPPSQASSAVKKTSRPMPASARAKLQQQQEDQPKIVKNNSEPKVQTTTAKPASRPMPASVRIKLEAQAKASAQESNKVPQPKPARPMPASVRAKLLTQNSTSGNSRDSSVSSSSSKPRRPMPASVKAKLGITQATEIGKGKETAAVESDDNDQPPVLKPEVIIETKANKIGQNAEKSPEIVVTLDDDDDDPMDNDYLPEPEVDEPSPPSVPTFSIADEIAEHNRAVRIAMSDGKPADSDFSFNMFQCKLCSKKFDTADSTRRHIHRVHSEYGPDHAENLIAQLFENYANTPRRRKSNVRYNEDYVDDDDEEVIIPRGTSRRPKQTDKDWTSSSEISGPVGNSYASSKTPISSDDSTYACKFCGARKDSVANVRRHIARAHPHLNDQRDTGVVVLGSDQQYMDPVVLPPPPSKPASSAKATAKSANPKAGGPIYVCRICSRCMAVRQSLYLHILNSHPDVEEGNAANYIQELNGGGSSSSSVPDNPVPVENTDSSFYCSMCQFQTSDESEYVRHHKSHTGGVSPYQCQYCSATFNRQQQLTAHVTREHTGAEFLTNDEAEISMEEVVGSNQISVATTSKIQIDSPKPVSLNRRSSSESNGQSTPAAIKKYTPGPASRKTAAARKSVPRVKKNDDVIPMDTTDNSPPASPASPIIENVEETCSPPQEQNETSAFSYQGDLSSLFPSLGGGSAPGGIDALDDIDGGMCLD